MPSYEPPFSLLIADDHQLIIDGLSKILEGEKMISAIHSALNGKETIEKVLHEHIDCVLMDINMPVLSGYEATKVIKEKKPAVKIIVVSMLCDASVVEKLLKAGADAFVIKNTSGEELVRTMVKVMKGEKYISPELSFDLFQYLKKNKNQADKGEHLTPREMDVIRYICEGMTNHEIANRLFLSVATIDTHRKNILAKLNLRNTASLVKYAYDHNLLS